MAAYLKRLCLLDSDSEVALDRLIEGGSNPVSDPWPRALDLASGSRSLEMDAESAKEPERTTSALHASPPNNSAPSQETSHTPNSFTPLSTTFLSYG